MRRTLLGIGIDEPRAGGLVERLLTEEEREMLADGGRAGGGDDARDTGDEGEEADVSGDGERRADVTRETLSGSDVTFVEGDEDDLTGTDPAAGETVSHVSDADAGAAGDGSESTSTGGTADDERAESAAGGEDATDDDRSPTGDTAGTGAGPSGGSTGGPAGTRPEQPWGAATGSSAAGGDRSTGPGRAGGRVPPGGPADATGAVETGHDEDGGRLELVKPYLIKGGAALAVLALLGFVAWRYGGKVKAMLPGSLGGSSDAGAGDDGGDSVNATATGDATTATGTAVSPARRRAKPTAADDSTGDGRQEAPSDREHRARTVEGNDAATGDGESAVRSPGEDVDWGALVGLGALALVAALVRKFGEEREYDPLVDGPREE